MLYGSIPVGFSRLGLKFIDIAFNNFDGLVPSELFLIDGIENIQIDNNDRKINMRKIYHT